MTVTPQSQPRRQKNNQSFLLVHIWGAKLIEIAEAILDGGRRLSLMPRFCANSLFPSEKNVPFRGIFRKSISPQNCTV